MRRDEDELIGEAWPSGDAREPTPAFTPRLPASLHSGLAWPTMERLEWNFFIRYLYNPHRSGQRIWPRVEDFDIVKRVLNGDVDSFRILVERYQRPVLSMIRRLIWDSHRCEDIGQDVFVAAFQKLSTFDPARSQFSTWLFTIARNMSINALKKKFPLAMEELPEIPVSNNPSQCLSDKEIFMQLDETLKTLPGKLQRAFILAEIEQMPYDEVARIEGARLGTIKSRINRARARVYAAMKGMKGDLR